MTIPIMRQRGNTRALAGMCEFLVISIGCNKTEVLFALEVRKIESIV